MNKIDQIKRLYKRIPSVQCKENCSACCGVIIFAKAEWDQIADKREVSQEALDEFNLTCPYVNEQNKCDIYEQRPMICRLMGASNEFGLKCPYGCKSAIPLSSEETRDIMQEYLTITKDEDVIMSI